MVIETKRCRGVCGLVKPINEFGEAFNNIRQQRYRKSKCKDCMAAYNREYGASHRVRMAELKRKYREVDPEKKRAQERASYYRNRDTALVSRKRYAVNNREAVRARGVKWRDANREYLRKQGRDYGRNRTEIQRKKDRDRAKIARDKIKYEVLKHYGNLRCACCGETILIMLTLDHINDNGGQHRKEMGPVSTKMYRWARNNGYPPIFRVLCFNCNVARYHNGGRCPHEDERLSLVA